MVRPKLPITSVAHLVIDDNFVGKVAKTLPNTVVDTEASVQKYNTTIEEVLNTFAVIHRNLIEATNIAQNPDYALRKPSEAKIGVVDSFEYNVIQLIYVINAVEKEPNDKTFTDLYAFLGNDTESGFIAKWRVYLESIKGKNRVIYEDFLSNLHKLSDSHKQALDEELQDLFSRLKGILRVDNIGQKATEILKFLNTDQLLADVKSLREITKNRVDFARSLVAEREANKAPFEYEREILAQYHRQTVQVEKDSQFQKLKVAMAEYQQVAAVVAAHQAFLVAELAPRLNQVMVEKSNHVSLFQSLDKLLLASASAIETQFTDVVGEKVNYNDSESVKNFFSLDLSLQACESLDTYVKKFQQSLEVPITKQTFIKKWFEFLRGCYEAIPADTPLQFKSIVASSWYCLLKLSNPDSNPPEDFARQYDRAMVREIREALAVMMGLGLDKKAIEQAVKEKSDAIDEFEVRYQEAKRNYPASDSDETKIAFCQALQNYQYALQYSLEQSQQVIEQAALSCGEGQASKESYAQAFVLLFKNLYDTYEKSEITEKAKWILATKILAACQLFQGIMGQEADFKYKELLRKYSNLVIDPNTCREIAEEFAIYVSKKKLSPAATDSVSYYLKPFWQKKLDTFFMYILAGPAKRFLKDSMKYSEVERNSKKDKLRVEVYEISTLFHAYAISHILGYKLQPGYEYDKRIKANEYQVLTLAPYDKASLLEEFKSVLVKYKCSDAWIKSECDSLQGMICFVREYEKICDAYLAKSDSYLDAATFSDTLEIAIHLSSADQAFENLEEKILHWQEKNKNYHYEGGILEAVLAFLRSGNDCLNKVAYEVSIKLFEGKEAEITASEIKVLKQTVKNKLEAFKKSLNANSLKEGDLAAEVAELKQRISLLDDNFAIAEDQRSNDEVNRKKALKKVIVAIDAIKDKTLAAIDADYKALTSKSTVKFVKGLPREFSEARAQMTESLDKSIAYLVNLLKSSAKYSISLEYFTELNQLKKFLPSSATHINKIQNALNQGNIVATSEFSSLKAAVAERTKEITQLIEEYNRAPVDECGEKPAWLEFDLEALYFSIKNFAYYGFANREDFCRSFNAKASRIQQQAERKIDLLSLVQGKSLHRMPSGLMVRDSLADLAESLNSLIHVSPYGSFNLPYHHEDYGLSHATSLFGAGGSVSTFENCIKLVLTYGSAVQINSVNAAFTFAGFTSLKSYPIDINGRVCHCLLPLDLASAIDKLSSKRKAQLLEASAVLLATHVSVNALAELNKIRENIDLNLLSKAPAFLAAQNLGFTIASLSSRLKDYRSTSILKESKQLDALMTRLEGVNNTVAQVASEYANQLAAALQLNEVGELTSTITPEAFKRIYQFVVNHLKDDQRRKFINATNTASRFVKGVLGKKIPDGPELSQGKFSSFAYDCASFAFDDKSTAIAFFAKLMEELQETSPNLPKIHDFKEIALKHAVTLLGNEKEARVWLEAFLTNYLNPSFESLLHSAQDDQIKLKVRCLLKTTSGRSYHYSESDLKKAKAILCFLTANDSLSNTPVYVIGDDKITNFADSVKHVRWLANNFKLMKEEFSRLEDASAILQNFSKSIKSFADDYDGSDNNYKFRSLNEIASIYDSLYGTEARLKFIAEVAFKRLKYLCDHSLLISREDQLLFFGCQNSAVFIGYLDNWFSGFKFLSYDQLDFLVNFIGKFANSPNKQSDLTYHIAQLAVLMKVEEQHDLVNFRSLVVKFLSLNVADDEDLQEYHVVQPTLQERLATVFGYLAITENLGLLDKFQKKMLVLLNLEDQVKELQALIIEAFKQGIIINEVATVIAKGLSIESLGNRNEVLTNVAIALLNTEESVYAHKVFSKLAEIDSTFALAFAFSETEKLVLAESVSREEVKQKASALNKSMNSEQYSIYLRWLGSRISKGVDAFPKALVCYALMCGVESLQESASEVLASGDIFFEFLNAYPTVTDAELALVFDIYLNTISNLPKDIQQSTHQSFVNCLVIHVLSWVDRGVEDKSYQRALYFLETFSFQDLISACQRNPGAMQAVLNTSDIKWNIARNNIARKLYVAVNATKELFAEGGLRSQVQLAYQDELSKWLISYLSGNDRKDLESIENIKHLENFVSNFGGQGINFKDLKHLIGDKSGNSGYICTFLQAATYFYNNPQNKVLSPENDVMTSFISKVLAANDATSKTIETSMRTLRETARNCLLGIEFALLEQAVSGGLDDIIVVGSKKYTAAEFLENIVNRISALKADASLRRQDIQTLLEGLSEDLIESFCDARIGQLIASCESQILNAIYVLLKRELPDQTASCLWGMLQKVFAALPKYYIEPGILPGSARGHINYNREFRLASIFNDNLTPTNFAENYQYLQAALENFFTADTEFLEESFLRLVSGCKKRNMDLFDVLINFQNPEDKMKQLQMLREAKKKISQPVILKKIALLIDALEFRETAVRKPESRISELTNEWDKYSNEVAAMKAVNNFQKRSASGCSLRENEERFMKELTDFGFVINQNTSFQSYWLQKFKELLAPEQNGFLVVKCLAEPLLGNNTLFQAMNQHLSRLDALHMYRNRLEHKKRLCTAINLEFTKQTLCTELDKTRNELAETQAAIKTFRVKWVLASVKNFMISSTESSSKAAIELVDSLRSLGISLGSMAEILRFYLSQDMRENILQTLQDIVPGMGASSKDEEKVKAALQSLVSAMTLSEGEADYAVMLAGFMNKEWMTFDPARQIMVADKQGFDHFRNTLNIDSIEKFDISKADIRQYERLIEQKIYLRNQENLLEEDLALIAARGKNGDYELLDGPKRKANMIATFTDVEKNAKEIKATSAALKKAQKLAAESDKALAAFVEGFNGSYEKSYRAMTEFTVAIEHYQIDLTQTKDLFFTSLLSLAERLGLDAQGLSLSMKDNDFSQVKNIAKIISDKLCCVTSGHFREMQDAFNAFNDRFAEAVMAKLDSAQDGQDGLQNLSLQIVFFDSLNKQLTERLPGVKIKNESTITRVIDRHLALVRRPADSQINAAPYLPKNQNEIKRLQTIYYFVQAFGNKYQQREIEHYLLYDLRQHYFVSLDEAKVPNSEYQQAIINILSGIDHPLAAEVIAIDKVALPGKRQQEAIRAQACQPLLSQVSSEYILWCGKFNATLLNALDHFLVNQGVEEATRKAILELHGLQLTSYLIALPEEEFNKFETQAILPEDFVNNWNMIQALLQRAGLSADSFKATLEVLANSFRLAAEVVRIGRTADSCEKYSQKISSVFLQLQDDDYFHRSLFSASGESSLTKDFASLRHDASRIHKQAITYSSVIKRMGLDNKKLTPEQIILVHAESAKEFSKIGGADSNFDSEVKLLRAVNKECYQQTMGAALYEQLKCLLSKLIDYKHLGAMNAEGLKHIFTYPLYDCQLIFEQQQIDELKGLIQAKADLYPKELSQLILGMKAGQCIVSASIQEQVLKAIEAHQVNVRENSNQLKSLRRAVDNLANGIKSTIDFKAICATLPADLPIMQLAKLEGLSGAINNLRRDFTNFINSKTITKDLTVLSHIYSDIKKIADILGEAGVDLASAVTASVESLELSADVAKFAENIAALKVIGTQMNNPACQKSINDYISHQSSMVKGKLQEAVKGVDKGKFALTHDAMLHKAAQKFQLSKPLSDFIKDEIFNIYIEYLQAELADAAVMAKWIKELIVISQDYGFAERCINKASNILKRRIIFALDAQLPSASAIAVENLIALRIRVNNALLEEQRVKAPSLGSDFFKALDILRQDFNNSHISYMALSGAPINALDFPAAMHQLTAAVIYSGSHYQKMLLLEKIIANFDFYKGDAKSRYMAGFGPLFDKPFANDIQANVWHYYIGLMLTPNLALYKPQEMLLAIAENYASEHNYLNTIETELKAKISALRQHQKPTAEMQAELGACKTRLTALEAKLTRLESERSKMFERGNQQWSEKLVIAIQHYLDKLEALASNKQHVATAAYLAEQLKEKFDIWVGASSCAIEAGAGVMGNTFGTDLIEKVLSTKIYQRLEKIQPSPQEEVKSHIGSVLSRFSVFKMPSSGSTDSLDSFDYPTGHDDDGAANLERLVTPHLALSHDKRALAQKGQELIQQHVGARRSFNT